MFDHVDRLFYKYHEIGFKYSGSYIDSKKKISKTKKAKIYPKKDDNCFHCAVTVA